MYNSLSLANRSAIKDFFKTIGRVDHIYEVGTRHSSDLKKIIKFNSNESYIDYIEFNKILHTKIKDCELSICIDTLCYISSSWKDVLEYFVSKSEYSIIINPMWTIGNESIDFKVYGEDWYLKNVPLIKSESYIKKWFGNHNSFDVATGKKIRDSYGVWQTGITDSDLKNTLKSLKCDVIKEYYLGFNTKPWIHNKAYLIKKVQK